jgi:hypothetical protein
MTSTDVKRPVCGSQEKTAIGNRWSVNSEQLAAITCQLLAAIDCNLNQSKTNINRGSKFPGPIRLLNHSKAAGYRCHRLARLHKSNRLLLELKRVTTTRCLRHLRVPFAIKAAC